MLVLGPHVEAHEDFLSFGQGFRARRQRGNGRRRCPASISLRESASPAPGLAGLQRSEMATLTIEHTHRCESIIGTLDSPGRLKFSTRMNICLYRRGPLNQFLRLSYFIRGAVRNQQELVGLQGSLVMEHTVFGNTDAV